MTLIPIVISFDGALQGMLVLAGKVHDLTDLGLRDVVSENAANTDTFLMHMKHDPRRLILRLLKKDFLRLSSADLSYIF